MISYSAGSLVKPCQLEPVEMYLYRRILFCIAYYVTHAAHFIRQLLCIEDKNVSKKQLSHHERVERVYLFLHYVAVKTGAFSKYTEGHYNGHKYNTIYDYYNTAQRNQLNHLLDCCNISQNKDENCSQFKLLDAGCGNGDLSYKAKYERGISTIGLTMSQQEVIINKHRGLKAMKHSFRNLKSIFEENEFDAIISNGSSEHLVSLEEALKDRGDSVMKQQLKEYWHVLKPGGYLCFTMVHVKEIVDPIDMTKDAWEYPLESTYWHYCVLGHFYSGWYPQGNQVTRIANEIGYELISKDETVDDYLQTSLVWRKKLKEALSTFRGIFWSWYIMFYFLFTDPIYCYYCLAHHWGGTWTWQFSKRYDIKNNKEIESPMTHYTLTFKKPLKNLQSK